MLRMRNICLACDYPDLAVRVHNDLAHFHTSRDDARHHSGDVALSELAGSAGHIRFYFMLLVGSRQRRGPRVRASGGASGASCSVSCGRVAGRIVLLSATAF
jgi:hypothetical protein